MRTIEALVADAVASEDPASAERDLLAAVGQASSSHDGEMILCGIPASVPIAKRRTIALRALRSARDREDVWIFRHVAEFQAHDLGEPAAARETLREAERMLLALANEDRALAFYWGVLATGARRALLDDIEALRLLRAGWALGWRQHDVENLGRIANQWRDLDRVEAIARLSNAETAAAEWGNLGGIIYWWHALGDVAAANRVRQTTLETTTRFSEALDLVSYWHLYEKESPGVEAALDRAEALAASAEEFFELAGRAHVGDAPEIRRRRILDRAAAIANTPEIKARIATAYVAWFADEEAADRVGPRGLRPEDLCARVTKLEDWPSSASDLFDWLRAHVTAEQLSEMADADYGTDAKEHLAALETICKSGLVPLELPWHPLEVAQLTRWSSGPDVDHLQRALACVLLCLSASENELISTGPPLVESCLALGEEASLYGEHFLSWKHETSEEDSGEQLVALLLLFLLRVARTKDPRLENLLRSLSAAPEISSLPEWIAGSVNADLWTTLLDRFGVSLPVAADDDD